jgi:hypothetical protein
MKQVEAMRFNAEASNGQVWLLSKQRQDDEGENYDEAEDRK